MFQHDRAQEICKSNIMTTSLQKKFVLQQIIKNFKKFCFHKLFPILLFNK